MRFWLLCLIAIGQLTGTDVIQGDREPQYLFVISGQSGSFANNRLTLQNVPAVIYFSDHPKRVAGQIPVEQFLKNWDADTGAFSDSPPKATLSFLEGKETAKMELEKPQFYGNTLSVTVKSLEGKIPTRFNQASLFIDSGKLP